VPLGTTDTALMDWVKLSRSSCSSIGTPRARRDGVGCVRIGGERSGGASRRRRRGTARRTTGAGGVAAGVESDCFVPPSRKRAPGGVDQRAVFFFEKTGLHFIYFPDSLHPRSYKISLKETKITS